jgi:G:T-mismatch repair DNA endonuclease (very short patch repair protein)
LNCVELVARRIYRFDPKNVTGRDQLELAGVGWRVSVTWSCFNILLDEVK